MRILNLHVWYQGFKPVVFLDNAKIDIEIKTKGDAMRHIFIPSWSSDIKNMGVSVKRIPDDLTSSIVYVADCVFLYSRDKRFVKVMKHKTGEYSHGHIIPLVLTSVLK